MAAGKLPVLMPSSGYRMPGLLETGDGHVNLRRHGVVVRL